MEISELPKAIEKAVEAYSKEVETGIEQELEKTADKIIEAIKSSAPRSGGPDALADSFIKETFGSGSNRIIVIFSKTKSGLVHLVELGFKHRSGKFVAARPFMRPAYENCTPEMLEAIKGIIVRGGG